MFCISNNLGSNHALVVWWQVNRPHFRIISDRCMIRNAAASEFVVTILKDFWVYYGKVHVPAVYGH